MATLTLPRGSIVSVALARLFRLKRPLQLFIRVFRFVSRRSCRVTLSALFIPIGILKATSTSSSKSLIEEADLLFAEDKMEALLERLAPYGDSKDADILWRLARACYKVAKLPKTQSKDSKKLAEDALLFINKALELDDSNFACFEWAGIIIGLVSDFEGPKVKIKNAYIMRDYFQTAIELNPKNATCRHLMGQWCYSVATMPWYIRQVSSALFATPPQSSLEEALNHFQKAEKLDPGFYSTNLLYLGKTHLGMGQREEARKWLTKTVQFDGPCAGDVEDKIAKSEASELLKNL